MRRADPVAAAAARRGAVVGLTLAEVMLLLCFCLAMATAAGIAHERSLREAATEALARERAEARLESGAGAVRGLVEAEAARTGADPDDLWRRLVAAERASPQVAGQGIAQGSVPVPPEGRAPEANAAVTPQAKATAAQPDAKGEEGLMSLAGTTLARLARGLTGRHDWPPIVTLSEAGGFRFGSGSSSLTPDFASALRTSVVPRLSETGRAYDVDVIEVVGHTDGQPLASGSSNLDATLVDALRGRAATDALRAGDNAGLGLARAVTVAAALRRDPRLDGFLIVPLSAGQAVGPDLRPGAPGADPRRRRIEIRMRKGPGQSG